jgi:hypothetical protein
MTSQQLAPPRHRVYAFRAVWWTFALYPVSFVAAFVVGEGLLSLYGYEVGDATTPPVWAVLGAGVPALLVFAVPSVLAVHFASRAARDGRPNWIGMWVSVGVTALFVVQNLAQYLLGLLLD